jgi:hypothetical protein
MPDREIPFWIEKVASDFRKAQRGEIAGDDQIDEARRLMIHESNQQLPRKFQKEEK